MPWRWQAWPKRAGCWSPATPAMMSGSPRIDFGSMPKACADGWMSGRIACGTRSRRSSSASHSPVLMSNSIVREAFDGSVTCVRLPVSCQMSQVSTVPKASSPRSARARAPGTWSRIQAILVPLKYGSTTSPVFERISASATLCISSVHNAEVRRSCQTNALWIGSPVCRSQTMVVSRWLVMPTPIRSVSERLSLRSTSRATSRWVLKRSIGSCSTQPGCGKIWRNSRCATDTGAPSWSNRIARELVVPWSRARTYFKRVFLVSILPWRSLSLRKPGIAIGERRERLEGCRRVEARAELLLQQRGHARGDQLGVQGIEEEDARAPRENVLHGARVFVARGEAHHRFAETGRELALRAGQVLHERRLGAVEVQARRSRQWMLRAHRRADDGQGLRRAGVPRGQEGAVDDEVHALARRDQVAARGAVHAPDRVDPDAGRVDHAARPELVARAGLAVLDQHAADAPVFVNQADRRAMVQHRGAASDRRTREGKREPGVVELPVPVLDGARQVAALQARCPLERLRGAQEFAARVPVLAGEQVVQREAAAIEPFVEPAAARAVHRQHESERLDKVRSVAHQDGALVQRFADQPEVALREVAHAAVRELRRARRSPLGEVLGLDQRDREAARRGVERHAEPGGAAADDHQIPRRRLFETAREIRSVGLHERRILALSEG